MLATGGRPTLLSEEACSGMREHAITSDDIFTLPKEPGKTLVVGGGYIALECAGFLRGLGYDVTIMTRAVYLRQMDRQVVNYITEYMRYTQKINFVEKSLPYLIQKTDAGRLFVKWKGQSE